MLRTSLRVMLVAAATAMAAGCSVSSVPREHVTFAVLSGVYYSALPGVQVEGAAAEDGGTLLKKAIADLNAMKDLDFVVLSGDLFARPDALSLDRAKAMLDELRVPYCMILGEYDGPAAPVAAASAASGTAGGAGRSAGGASVPGAAAGGPGRGAAPGAAVAGGGAQPGPAIGCISRSGITWAFQGHGFSGPRGYWSQELLPGLVVVGLDTVRPGGPAAAPGASAIRAAAGGAAAGTAGHVDAEQLAWLDRTLSAQAGKAVILVSHHGIVPLHPLDEGVAWGHMMIDNAADVQGIIGRHPNVVVAVTGRHHFAEGRTVGRTVHLSVPSVSVWPLAFSLVRLTAKEAEATWVPLGSEDASRRAQDALLSSRELRGVFPSGDDGDTACVRVFGGKKVEVYPLPGIRP
jgi:3',5'-cyclic AMP phosphodiesterase CpdA